MNLQCEGYGRDTPDNFFPKVDTMGGWPIEAKSVVMKHGFSPFDCYFSKNEYVRDEWNTTLFTADDYYLWKLSEKSKDKLREEGFKEAKNRIGFFR